MAENQPRTTRAGTLSLDHLIALNDEIVALARAGLPLERGLCAVGGDLSGTLKSAMLGLSQRMEQGESLAEALEAEGNRFPPVYRSVVKAGLRAGRLSAALESLASFIRGYADARHAIGLALWYPSMVLVLAYSLFLFLIIQIIPRIIQTFESLRIPRTAPVNALAAIGETAAYWGAVPPLVFAVFAILWVWSGRASGLRARGFGISLRWVPWMGALVSQFEAANFAQLLAILLEHDVPLGEAIVLASGASAEPAVSRAGQALATAVEAGQPPTNEVRDAGAFPPLMVWLISNPPRNGHLSAALREIAVIYRKRAAYQAEKIKVVLPTVLLFAIGMSATLVYGLTLFLPFTTLLTKLSGP
jgi:general secretion pathway protein F